MARGQTIKFLRTTRANLETQKTASGLILGEPYLITDENRIAIATAVNAYYDFALKSELHSAETTTTIGALINGATAKTTPVDADMVGLMDSVASNILKKTSWANIKATLKVYFDALYTLANLGGVPTSRTINSQALTADITINKTVRVAHTWAISGEIKVPSGDTDFICPMIVKLPTGQTGKLVSCRYKINSGTSVTIKITKNGTDATGFTSMSVGTTVAETDPTDVTLADNDVLVPVVTAVSGTPKNMSFTIFIDYTV